MTMRRLLIALLALMLSAVSLAAPAEAQGSWTCTYNFSQGANGWTINSGTLVSGGVESVYTSAEATNREHAIISRSMSGSTLTSISSTFTAATTVNVYYEPTGGPSFYSSGNVSAGSTITRTWTGSQSISSLRVVLVHPSSGTNTVYTLHSVTVQGTGTLPCTATPTPVPSATTVLTATPIIINTFATPTPIAIDGSGIYEALQQGNNSVIGLPADLAAAGRPPDEDGSEIFAYVKWFVSPSSADELAGPFAPIVSHTGIFLALVFAMTVIYAVVWAAVWLLKFVVWVFKLITGNLVLSVIFIVVAAIGAIVMLLTKILEAIK
jgi:hypothetical protein